MLVLHQPSTGTIIKIPHPTQISRPQKQKGGHISMLMVLFVVLHKVYYTSLQLPSPHTATYTVMFFCE